MPWVSHIDLLGGQALMRITYVETKGWEGSDPTDHTGPGSTLASCFLPRSFSFISSKVAAQRLCYAQKTILLICSLGKTVTAGKSGRTLKQLV